MARDIITTYQAVIEPVVDSAQWNKATRSIEGILDNIKSPFITKKNLTKALRDAEKKLGKASKPEEKEKAEEEVAKAKAALNAFNAETSAAKVGAAKFTAGIGAAVKGVSTFAAVIAIAAKAAKAFSDASIGFGNKLISSQSIGINTDVRGYMAKYGVSSKQGAAMDAVLGVTGYNLSEVATWTDAQKKHYANLMKMYQEGIDSLDTNKLERFTTATQNLQLKFQEHQLKLQMRLQEILVNSDVDKLLDHIADSFEVILNILKSPIIQWGFNAIITILDWLTQFANAVGSAIGYIIGAPQETSTNNTDNSTKTVTQTNNFYGIDENAIAEKLVYNSASAVG